MAKIQTPGVYIQERNAFPNSIVQVETAIPAFVGYTEKASFNGENLLNKPIQINSYNEYVEFFGEGAKTTYGLVASTKPDIYIDGKAYVLNPEKETKFNMFDAMKFFYQNGGEKSYIVSVGTYGKDKVTITPNFSITPFIKGLKKLEKELVPTMLLIPDAILLSESDCFSLQEHMLNHCGTLQNRIAILDIYGGDNGLKDPSYNPIDNFRNNISSDFLQFGAAYYPWLNTTITQTNEVNYTLLNKGSLGFLKTNSETFMANFTEPQKAILQPYLDDLIKPIEEVNEETIHKVMSLNFPNYKLIMDALMKNKNLLAPAAAMAGIYTMVDNTRGVWKAPANVAVNSVVSPTVLIDHNQQEDLNAPILGKSICAIRSFTGVGIMVWGARTLDANSLDWKYINVRRTMIMLEQSIKCAITAYIFEPNVKNTWVSIQAMINNFLTNIWNQGGLAGASPEDAFNVALGLGTTMTPEDIIEGKMRIEVKVAISHPAEFIVMNFEQQMQQS